MIHSKTIYDLMLLTSFLILTPLVVMADEVRELTDAELDSVTAGTDSGDETENLTTFAFKKTTRSGNTIEAEGSFQLVEVIDRATIGNIILTDGAQGNLSSLININAVNSDVYVLLNLNININSSVGSLNQYNLNGLVPTIYRSP